MGNEYEGENDGFEDVPDVPDEPKTATEKEYDRQIQRLDTFFAAVQPGVTLLIERMKPSWCSGLLEELTVGDEALTLDYFIDTWGGQLLSVKVRGKRGQLKGSYKVPLYTYPPLRYGEQIRQNDRGDRFRHEDDFAGNAPPPPQPVIVNPPQGMSLDKVFAALPALVPVITQMLTSQETRRQADMTMMMQMMKSQQGGGLGDITKVGAVMGQLNEIFKSNAGGGDSSGGDMDFLTHAMDVLKIAFDKKQPAQVQQTQNPQSRLAPPSMSRGSGSPPPSSPPSKPASVTPIDRLPNIVKSLSEMEPSKVSETVLLAIGSMPPDKREAAIDHLMGEYDSLMGGDPDFEAETQDDNSETRGVK